MPIRIKVTLIILAAILFALVVGPLIVPIRELENTVPAAQLADPDSLFVDIGELGVHYKAAGEGEPAFLLLHGFGASLFSWRHLLAPLGEFGTAIAFDRPAFGLTSRPIPGEWTGTNPYSPEGQTDLLLGLMDELGIEKAVLVGNSDGGTVAVQFALEHPERTEALILISPAVYASGGAPAWARPLLYTPQLNRVGPAIMRQLGGEPGAQFIRSAWHDPQRIDSETLLGYRKPLQVDDWDRALWELTKASREIDFSGRLETLAVPALVIAGDGDQIVPLEQTQRVARELPNARLVALQACGHVPQEECPEATLAAIEDFLATTDAPLD